MCTNKKNWINLKGEICKEISDDSCITIFILDRKFKSISVKKRRIIVTLMLKFVI